jgi:23S rRNA (uracil1939-C5)-methyltransferase
MNWDSMCRCSVLIKFSDVASTGYLQAEPSNTLGNQVRGYALRTGLTFYDLRNHEGNLRNLIIRTSSSTGEVMVVVVVYVEQEQVDRIDGIPERNFPR